MIATLGALGYTVDWKILNALDFGLPQNRERIFIVATDHGRTIDWPSGNDQMKPLSVLLERNPASRHIVSERIRQARHNAHQASVTPAIWQENKGGNVSSQPLSCALRAGASYNYLLVDGNRRLTPRELFRLQGFPESFVLPKTDAAARRLSGNSVPVPTVRARIQSILLRYASRQITIAV